MTATIEPINAAHESLTAKTQPTPLHTTTKPPGGTLPSSATATQGDAVDLSTSLTGIVAQKTKTLSDTLLAALHNAGIDVDDSVILTVTPSGLVTASGPYKERIEEFLRDNPDIARDLKEIASLSNLIAVQEANDLYQREKEKAKQITDPAERARAERNADMHHTMHMLAISDLSGGVAYSNGMFSSAALDYIRVAETAF